MSLGLLNGDTDGYFGSNLSSSSCPTDCKLDCGNCQAIWVQNLHWVVPLRDERFQAHVTNNLKEHNCQLWENRYLSNANLKNWTSHVSFHKMTFKFLG